MCYLILKRKYKKYMYTNAVDWYSKCWRCETRQNDNHQYDTQQSGIQQNDIQ